jgi:hypothetical protein
VAEAPSLDKSEEKKESFLKNPFEYIQSKWIAQVKTNEEQFNAAVTSLQDFEGTLIQSLTDIEKLETQCLQVKEAYATNVHELNDIRSHQTMMINELDTIEKDLDGILKGQGGQQNKFIEEAFKNKSMRDLPNREQVFRQAVTLGKEITSLQGELQSCQHALESSDRNHKEAAEQYLLVGDPTKKQQVSNCVTIVRCMTLSSR